jgi:diacylglycerol O-acyltransferase
VVLEQLPKKRGQTERQALQQRCGELAVTPLDPDRPLWQFHLVERYEGGSAIIARIHHCIGDGIALISVMNSITDGGNDPPKRRRKTVDDDGDHDWLSDAVLKPLTGLAVKALDMYGSGVARSIEALSHPRSRCKAHSTWPRPACRWPAISPRWR